MLSVDIKNLFFIPVIRGNGSTKNRSSSIQTFFCARSHSLTLSSSDVDVDVVVVRLNPDGSAARPE